MAVPMVKRLQSHASTIVIIVAFYVSSFFVVANLVRLNTQQIGLGLVAGAIGGLFVFISKIVNEQQTGQSARR